MLAPREQVDPYLIETKNEHKVKFTKTDGPSNKICETDLEDLKSLSGSWHSQ